MESPESVRRVASMGQDVPAGFLAFREAGPAGLRGLVPPMVGLARELQLLAESDAAAATGGP